MECHNQVYTCDEAIDPTPNGMYTPCLMECHNQIYTCDEEIDPKPHGTLQSDSTCDEETDSKALGMSQ